MLPISSSTWKELVQLGKRCTESGWAEEGIFAPAIGPNYTPGSKNSILFVGKSAGPLGGNVGSSSYLRSSILASTEWMLQRHNKRGFWVVPDEIDKHRRQFAWTNVCKIDQKGKSAPPQGAYWDLVRQPCLNALRDEIFTLKPMTIVFLISNTYQFDCIDLMYNLGYEEEFQINGAQFNSIFLRNGDFKCVFTKHPQGWSVEDRAPVIRFIRERYSS
ncbi:MAG: hypothetical protein WBO55_03890 [Rhizobiaceae bacterium]